MRGLLLKDLYCVKEYLKQLGFVMICMILMTIFLKNTSLIGFYLVFISLSVLSTTIVADEKCGWDRCVLTYPMDRTDVVKEKYMLLLLLGCGAEMISLILNVIIAQIFHTASLQEAVVTSFVIFFVYMYAFCAYVPAIYKIGTEKARYVLIGVLMIPTLLILWAARTFPELDDFGAAAGLSPILGIAALILGIIIFVVSYNISVRIYEKKEF